MFSRPMLFVGVLAACVAVPYLLLDKNLSQTARAQFNRLLGRSASTDENPLANLQLPWSGGTDKATTVEASAPAVVATLEEAFRGDVTPHWVTSRWPRVSTVLSETEQLGMRVAFVSGTQPDDVAGSLTYYFDDHHHLQRITFYGLTGDERRLMATVVGGYRLKSVPTTNVARYIAGDPEQPTSSVTVRHLPIVRAESSHARVELAVDLRLADGRSGSGDFDDSASPPLPQAYRPW